MDWFAREERILWRKIVPPREGTNQGNISRKIAPSFGGDEDSIVFVVKSVPHQPPREEKQGGKKDYLEPILFQKPLHTL